MADLAHKTKHALDESRMLVLGLQVLLGFGLRAFFEPVFQRLLWREQLENLITVAFEVVTLTLLFAGPTRHLLVERGECTPRFHAAAMAHIRWALLPFAAVLALDLRQAAGRVWGSAVAGWIAGAATFAVALACWYAVEFVVRARRGGPKREEEEMKPTPIETKVEQVLTEARVILPGAQALLGFQFIIILMDAFGSMPFAARVLHLGSLALVALSTVLLMMPAAFHRIVERGEDTERMHRDASFMLLAALGALGLGLAGDFGLVTWRVFHSFTWGVAVGAATVVLFFTAWFAVPLLIRAIKPDGAQARAGG